MQRAILMYICNAQNRTIYHLYVKNVIIQIKNPIITVHISELVFCQKKMQCLVLSWGFWYFKEQNKIALEKFEISQSSFFLISQINK